MASAEPRIRARSVTGEMFNHGGEKIEEFSLFQRVTTNED